MKTNSIIKNKEDFEMLVFRGWSGQGSSPKSSIIPQGTTYNPPCPCQWRYSNTASNCKNLNLSIDITCIKNIRKGKT